MKTYNEKQGITLIALVLTIILLLILSGISISMLTGNNGILYRTADSKEKTDNSGDAEIIKLSYLNCLTKNQEKITKKNLKESLEQYEKNVDVLIDNDSFLILDKDTNKKYRLSNSGSVDGPIDLDIIKDNSPGDITKSKDGSSLAGDAEHPYEIWCIEDLIEWSNNYNNYLNNSIILCRDLDFKSELNYNNAETTSYGDYNNDGNITSLMDELSSGNGFKPIESYAGNLEGNNFELKNLYINSDSQTVGFISSIWNCTIKNLTISGEIISTHSGNAPSLYSTGAFVGRMVNNSLLYNCINKSNVYANGSSIASGIAGRMR